ncbi:MAG: AAA family ATPase [Mariprofundaceae bacterium]
MLAELHIGQFALIDTLHLSFARGMTVFSGETGAGKSVLVDALGAAFGCRANADWVRFGAERAEISAVLEDPGDALTDLLAEHDIEAGDQLILRRLISNEGRSKAYVNGTPAPLKLLQRIGEMCLDLHGQHEHQRLLNVDYQRDLIDARLGPGLLQRTASAFEHWRQAQKALLEFHREKDDSAGQKDWLNQELSQLQAINPEQGLAQRLHAEVEAGRHFAQIQEKAASSLALLDESESSVRDKLAQASRAIGQAAEFRPALGECSDMLTQMEALLGEISPSLRDIVAEDFDAPALAVAEQRLMDLHDAMRRHEVDETGLARLMAEMQDKLSALDTAAWDEEALRRRLASARNDYHEAALAFSQARQQAAKDLAQELRPLLDKLALAGMRIDIEVRAC